MGNTKAAKKDLLLNTAAILFNRHGYRAVGIDWILRDSNVSKATLYSHFRSKDDLIAEVLKRRHQLFSRWLQDKVSASAAIDSSERVAAVFDALSEWITDKTFRGCGFINAAAEFPDAEHPAHRYAAIHKQNISGFLYSLLDNSLPVATRQRLAEQIMVLMDGAVVAAQVRGDKNSIQAAARAAGVLMSVAVTGEVA